MEVGEESQENWMAYIFLLLKKIRYPNCLECFSSIILSRYKVNFWIENKDGPLTKEIAKAII